MEEWLDLSPSNGAGAGEELASSSIAIAAMATSTTAVTKNQNNIQNSTRAGNGGEEETERQNTGLLPKSFVDGTGEGGREKESITPLPTPSSSLTTVKPKQPSVHVRVGVGVLVKDPLDPHKVFAGIRKGSHGSNTLALPGGHLELQESWSQCATREVYEETGLRITNVVFGHVTNDKMPSENKHYVTIFMMGTCVQPNARPQNLEPHKCEGWSSYGWDELRNMIQAEQKEKDIEVEGEQGMKKKRKNPGTKSLPRLFGPLRHLVEDEPTQVLNFLKL
uniref:Nudix hydrolase domain-containing protein n=1 Tax=Ditylum brightwellii TaxID=49249 RepID=A0A7S1YR91_9STRA